ncbi:MAG: hypothetical protein EXQ94_07715 [Alphaproteobacteria bacterium]|nr:hypothetical protein [Alphaproteobacteria bacterium]
MAKGHRRRMASSAPSARARRGKGMVTAATPAAAIAFFRSRREIVPSPSRSISSLLSMESSRCRH